MLVQVNSEKGKMGEMRMESQHSWEMVVITLDHSALALEGVVRTEGLMWTVFVFSAQHLFLLLVKALPFSSGEPPFPHPPSMKIEWC